LNIGDFQKLVKIITDEEKKKFKTIIDEYEKIIILGNGGSNSIASHISQDYTKRLKKRAISFSDPSRLTCYINDYGLARAYEVFASEFGDKDTLVILISSSGNSDNIINTASYCRKKNIPIIILTGFERDNRLRKEFASYSNLEVWIDSCDYGIVECLHQSYLHMVV